MNAIVAVDRNWGIGREGSLLFRIPEDQKFVRGMTKGKVIVMGRATFLTFPGAQPLRDRVNVVLSSDPGFSPEGAVVCRNLEELREELTKYDTDDVFVFGGQKVYEELLPYCKFAYVTKVDADGNADRFFPNLEMIEGWGRAADQLEGEHEGLRFKICLYEKRNPAQL